MNYTHQFKWLILLLLPSVAMAESREEKISATRIESFAQRFVGFLYDLLTIIGMLAIVGGFCMCIYSFYKMYKTLTDPRADGSPMAWFFGAVISGAMSVVAVIYFAFGDTISNFFK